MKAEILSLVLWATVAASLIGLVVLIHGNQKTQEDDK
jgi:hypothetical protein